MSTRSVRYSTFNRSIRKGNLASTDRDALAFLEAAQVYNANQQRAIVNLVRSLKRVGLWTKMKAIYPFVGGTASSHKWNLKDPRDVDAAFRLTFSGGWTHSTNGAQPNGTNGYADTFLIPTTSLTQNNTHHSNYSRTSAEGAWCEIGCNTGTGAIQHLNRYSEPAATPNQVYSFQYRTNPIITPNPTGDGYYISSRTGANTFKVFKNNATLGTSTLSTSGWSTTNIKLFIGARNAAGTADLFSQRQCAFATIGDGLTDTDATNLYNIVDLYQKRLGRAV